MSLSNVIKWFLPLAGCRGQRDVVLILDLSSSNDDVVATIMGAAVAVNSQFLFLQRCKAYNILYKSLSGPKSHIQKYTNSL